MALKDTTGVRENLLSESERFVKVKAIGGVVRSEVLAEFKRKMVRMSRGKIHMETQELCVPEADTIIGDDYHTKRHSFVCSVLEGAHIEDKIRKVIEGYAEKENTVDIDLVSDVDREVTALNEEKLALKDIIRASAKGLKDWLMSASHPNNLEVSIYKIYKLYVLREKSINAHLNRLRQ